MDKLRTFKDYCEQHGDTPLIQSPYSDREYLKEYQEQYDEYMFTLDIDAKTKYGDLILATDDINVVTDIIRATCVRLDYKWSTLWDTLHLDYDPIANVDAHETVTTEYGEHVTETNLGERTTTNNMGERNTTNEIGARVTTNDMGERNTTNTIGARSENTTEKGHTFPYDTKQMTQTAQNEIENSSAKATDSTVTGAAQDVSTVDSTKDISKSDAVEDKTVVSSVQDENISRTHTDTVTTIRKGNIGVTSTQSLIQQTRDVAVFDFYSSVLEDIIEAITIPVYDDGESENCPGWFDHYYYRFGGIY